MSQQPDNHMLNPDSPMAQQSEGQWQRYLIAILFKLLKSEALFLTSDDLEEFAKEPRYLIINGHVDSIEFRVVNEDSAVKIMAYESNVRQQTEGTKQ